MRTELSITGVVVDNVKLDNINFQYEVSVEEFATLIDAYPELVSVFINAMERVQKMQSPPQVYRAA